ncbi:hypothetical protein, partial [Devosia sp.]|uniref:hypothetical protein n=1 Tax=Devosia sp. TaxID=1871048 RepID=UPI002AFDFFA4
MEERNAHGNPDVIPAGAGLSGSGSGPGRERGEEFTGNEAPGGFISPITTMKGAWEMSVTHEIHAGVPEEEIKIVVNSL